MFKITGVPSWTLSVSLVSAITLLTACSNQSALSVDPAKPEQFVETFLQQHSLPKLKGFEQRSADMHQVVDSLCAQPTEDTLNKAQAVWRELNRSWQGAMPLLFGPADKLNVKRKLGYWPTHETVLQVVVARDTADGVRNDPSVRGIAALEMMLFGNEGDVIASHWRIPQRCDHAQALSNEIHQLATELYSQWEQHYQNDFKALTAQRALSLITAEVLNTVEAILWQRLGMPANFFRGETEIHKAEAWRSQESLAGIRASLNAMHVILRGDVNSIGLVNVVVLDAPEQAKALALAVDHATHVLQPMPPSLKQAMADDLDSVEALFNAIQDTKEQLLAAATAMQLTVQFEEDGD